MLEKEKMKFLLENYKTSKNVVKHFGLQSAFKKKTT